MRTSIFMKYKKLLNHIKSKITTDFSQSKNPGLFFHNIDHTKEVVLRALKIGKHYKLEPEAFFILLAAAWFHDVGYLYGTSEGHEVRGAEIAGTYLSGKGFDNTLIESVKNIIIAATIDNQPEELLAQILYDADLYNLGTKAFSRQNKLVRKECEWQLKETITKQNWRIQTIEWMESHRFMTSYVQQRLETGKQKNLQKLKVKMPGRQGRNIKSGNKEKDQVLVKKKNLR